MRIAIAADELTGVAESLPEELRRRGHEPLLHGVYADEERYWSELRKQFKDYRLAE